MLPGETIGILGGIGSGKSTLMYLLERLYELPADSGRITIGGIDIAQMKASDLRAYIGIVLQEPYLFSRSIAENIGFALDDADPEKIREAARTACVHDTIEGFEKGYDTFVGERGVTLSGGQKQRVAIAQMLIRQTPVMIFDDSLSAVDARTDAMIRHALREKTKNSTVLLISHRITTIMHADRILVLDKGKLTEEGTHEELIRKGGLYSRIYGLQTAVV
ncbi:MAG: ATP-binding cassette domain-containing protein [Blautia sp.]|nr:ATP-binding cassette domain-containing protein [Blautia sp.]